MRTVRVGVVGCGAVSGMYLPILRRLAALEVTAVADVDEGTAAARAAEFDIGRTLTPEALVGDDQVDLVVNLTPIPVHAHVTRQALDQGKHVYCEKPFADTLAGALELVEVAEEKGLALGGAPDTVLGTAFQTARAALTDGLVGEPVHAVAVMVRSAVDPTSAYIQGANPFLDMAPYYVSALVNLFGPVRRVNAAATRVDDPGHRADQPVGLAGTLEFTNGLTAQLYVGWGSSYRHEVPELVVFGTEGEVRFSNPNAFGDPAHLRRYGEQLQEIDGSRQPAAWPVNLRGIGVGDMVLAVGEGREPAASGRLACHVVDVIEGMVGSAATGVRVDMATTIAVPPPTPRSTLDRILG